MIDTSALIAILVGEAEQAEFVRLMEEAPATWLSAASFVEAGMVLGPQNRPLLPALLESGSIQVAAVTAEQADLALAAHVRFGRGSGSKARLNFGDCFSYALARSLDQPLLFKGEDFTHTDVQPAR